MRVALYARYSSEKQKDSSIVDQFRNCEQRAAREGWTITARYEDKAISGAITDRPGYQQMLTDAKAKQFDVLVVDDLSRLTRDEAELTTTRKRLIFWGVRLIGVSDGFDTAQKGHKIHASFKGIMNELFIDDLREKIKRGMVGQVERQFWNGGRPYGYKVIPQFENDRFGQPVKIGTKLEIDPEQATWVRWIFQQYADGMSPLKIVAELNRRGITPPGASYAKRHYARGPYWNALALHGKFTRGTGILNNVLYRGLYRWGRAQHVKDPETGKTVLRWRDQSEWIETAVPHLRIIDETLWAQVEAKRLAVSQGVVALRASRHARARSTGRRPKNLFSGVLACGQCGGNYVICSPTDYACATWRDCGETDRTCSNALKVSRKLVESLLLEAIREDLFTEDGLAVFKEEVARLLAEQRRRHAPDLRQAQADLQVVERELAHMVQAIAHGVDARSLKEAIVKKEAERARLLQIAQGSSKVLDKVTTVIPDLVARFKTLVEDLAVVRQHDVDKARGIVQSLLAPEDTGEAATDTWHRGRIVLHPTSDGSERYLTAHLRGNYEALVPLAAGSKLKLTPEKRILEACWSCVCCRVCWQLPCSCRGAPHLLMSSPSRSNRRSIRT